MTKAIALAGIAAGLASCSTIDTGYVDYRRAQEPIAVSDAVGGYACARSENSPELMRRICEPLLAVDLVRKNVSAKVGIKEDDVYSIRLDHGFMHYVSELPFRPDRVLDGKNPFRAQAEIVVLARAFEFGPLARADVETTTSPAAPGGTQTESTTAPAPAQRGSAEAAFVDLEFESLNAARVIYYSPDVENGQSLNFSNIPILGPVKYGGRPVGIQLIVLELDRVSPEMKGLLSSLASIGQTAGAIPTGGATNILVSLGKSLLESNQDDVIFEYRFVLDPSDRVNSYNSAPFEEGRYVLRRLQSRSSAHVWRDIQLDHNTGQLILDRTADGQADAAPYTGETYFTINIINHGASAKEAVYVYQSMQELRGVIDASARAVDPTIITALNGEIEAATRNLRGNTMTRELAALWEKAAGDVMLLAYNSPPAQSPDPARCELRHDLPRKNRAELELAQSVTAFVRKWNEAVTQDGNQAARFGDDERLRVAGAVGSFFLGLDAAPTGAKPEVETFVDVAKFNELVNAGDDGSLLNRAKAYAAALAPDTCEELLGSGLARRPRAAT